MTTRSIAAELEGLEASYRDPARRSPASVRAVRVTHGSAPVVLTAPHSVPTVRDGAPKRREVYTGAWAELIAARTGGSSVTLLHPEPHETPEETICRTVEDLVGDGPLALLVDIHGMAERHGLDVCFGSGPEGQSGAPARCLHEHLHDELRVSIDRPFRGADATVSRWVTDRYPATEVCQIELGPRLRTATAHEAHLDAVARAIATVVAGFAASYADGAS